MTQSGVMVEAMVTQYGVSGMMRCPILHLNFPRIDQADLPPFLPLIHFNPVK